MIWPFKCSEYWSILSAYAQEGFITRDITRGSFTAKMFNNFVKNNLLPLYSLFSKPRSIIIVDNCKIHHNDVSS